ncbi:Uncharacterized protein APZ42_012071 [Daphnia magna]|uniref:Uncharacterized protein n=1 Tax=Daphnia magna TaxID=35525 RepID=A0A162S228_9CRUS|nr:Uncharacterized protein APZ42_012071 [Daphnia magna]
MKKCQQPHLIKQYSLLFNRTLLSFLGYRFKPFVKTLRLDFFNFGKYNSCSL